MRNDGNALTRRALEAASRYFDVTDGEQILDDVTVIVTDRAVAAADAVLEADLFETTRETSLTQTSLAVRRTQTGRSLTPASEICELVDRPRQRLVEG